MGWLRGLSRAIGAALLLALVVVAVAPGPACVLDRGAGEEVRASLLPLALVFFDPATWQAIRDSSAVAGAATLGSVVIGLGLGLVIAGRRFWGRKILNVLAVASLALGPMVTTPGLILALGGTDGWDWLAARSLLGVSCEELARWALLTWAEMGVGVPLVILATTEAIRRIEPGWADAAKGIGATPRQIWRDVTWPILRPDVARTAAAIFALTLVEPAGPSILGLRRTIAVQILDAARRLDQPTRAAALACLAGIIALAAAFVLRRWGGRTVDRPSLEQLPPPPRAGQVLGMASALAVAAWVATAVGPGVVVLWRTLIVARDERSGGWANLARCWVLDPEIQVWVRNAVVAGALAVGVDLLILASIAGRGPRRLGRSIVAALESFPPLALGVGALAAPWLLLALADTAGPGIARWIRPLALELAPARNPGWLLILTLAAARLAKMSRAADLAWRQARPALADVARSLGVSPRRAARAGDPRWLGIVPGRTAFLAFALATTSLSPALLLTPTQETRTLAPAAFGLIVDSEPGAIDPRAAGPLVALLVVQFLGLAIASTGRSIPIGRWFRG